MSLLTRIRCWLRPHEDEPGDVLASLLLAAKDDQAFRRQVLFVLEAPPLQRASLIHSAVHEMTLRGEPAAVRSAFALLATDSGARAAREVLRKH